jgi:hypothetical protein
MTYKYEAMLAYETIVTNNKKNDSNIVFNQWNFNMTKFNGYVLKIFFLLLCNYSVYAINPIEVHNKALLKYIEKNMQNFGTLVESNDGYVYIDIDRDYSYVTEILKQFKDVDYTINRSANSNIGTHISVMFSNETKDKNIKELGNKIYFKPIGFYKVNKDNNEYLLLGIESITLNEIRKEYELSPAPTVPIFHTFHITIGAKKLNK